MGNITLSIDATRDFSVFTVTGAPAPDAFKAAITDYYAGPVTQFMLWDYTDATLGHLTTADFESFTALTLKYVHLRPNGRTALVFVSDLNYGMGRMYLARQDIAEASWSHRGFRSRQDAEDWLFDGTPNPNQ